MARRSAVSFLACSALLTLSAAASAHVRLVYPQPRYATPGNTASSARIKSGPCGCSTTMMMGQPAECPNGDVRDPSRVTVLQPGATITVEFSETVQHPGFYRISFDNDGQDAFTPPPLARTSIQMGATTLPVLKDNIADTGEEDYTAEITLPNVECENCTLQLIQVMVTGATWAANNIYYTCADIALRSGAGGAGGMGAGGMSAGGMAGGGMSAGGIGAGGMAGGGMSAGGMGAGGLSAGTAGTLATGGMGTGGLASGGAGVGGTPPTGGAGMAAAATGGMLAGMPGTGGAPAAGSPSTGGTPPATGGVGTGGSTTGGSAGVAPPEEPPGCGCRVVPRSASLGWLVLGAGAVAATLTRRRRRAR